MNNNKINYTVYKVTGATSAYTKRKYILLWEKEIQQLQGLSDCKKKEISKLAKEVEDCTNMDQLNNKFWKMYNIAKGSEENNTMNDKQSNEITDNTPSFTSTSASNNGYNQYKVDISDVSTGCNEINCSS